MNYRENIQLDKKVNDVVKFILLVWEQNWIQILLRHWAYVALEVILTVTEKITSWRKSLQ